MILNEVYNSRNEDLDYLAEYLIQKPKLTLTEAKELIQLIEDEKQTTWAKIKDASDKALKKLGEWKKSATDIARRNLSGKALKARLDKIADIYRVKKGYIEMDMKKGGSVAIGRAKRAKAAVRAAFYTANTMPKKGKIGVAAGAGAGLAAGLVAYKGKQKRKEALAKKK